MLCGEAGVFRGGVRCRSALATPNIAWVAAIKEVTEEQDQVAE
jgi:hypothetical protein